MKRSLRYTLYAGLVMATAAAWELPHLGHLKVQPVVTETTPVAMAASADMVLRGRVTKQLGTKREVDASGHDMVYTRWQITPDATFKGARQGSVVVRTLGGRYLSTWVEAEDQPEYAVGQSVMVFLNQPADWQGDFRTAGEFQGAYRIRQDGQAQQMVSQTSMSLADLEATVR